MSYQQYGISEELVSRIKLKLNNPATMERVKACLVGVTKADLQQRAKIRKLIGLISKVMGVKLTEQQKENITQYVISQKIDPNNKFHLLKLWATFR